MSRLRVDLSTCGGPHCPGWLLERAGGVLLQPARPDPTHRDPQNPDWEREETHKNVQVLKRVADARRMGEPPGPAVRLSHEDESQPLPQGLPQAVPLASLADGQEGEGGEGFTVEEGDLLPQHHDLGTPGG